MTQNSSTWLNTLGENEGVTEKYPVLVENKKTDVLVVGGGMAGILSAYLLHKAGKQVIVIDKGKVDDSNTAYTTAFLTYYIDTSGAELVSLFGKTQAQKIYQSGMEAIDCIEKIVEEEKIDCEFKRVSEFVFARTKKEAKDLKKEAECLQSLGMDVALQSENAKGNTMPFKNECSLEIKNQAKFHPLKFLLALKRKMEGRGVQFFDETEAVSMHGMSPVEVLVSGGYKIVAQDVVVATYNPFHNPTKLFAHKGMYTSYVLEARVPTGIIPEALYLDMKNPYHYVRVDKGTAEDRVIVGGEDHREELPMNAEKNFNILEKYFQKLIPQAKYRVTNKWEGYILESVDGLPYIGRYSPKEPHVLVATAFSGNGMTYSAISGMIFRDIILAAPNPYISVYNARRKVSTKAFFSKFVDYGMEFFGGFVKNLFK